MSEEESQDRYVVASVGFDPPLWRCTECDILVKSPEGHNALAHNP